MTRHTAFTMTEHDKIEHVLPNGDTLIVDSTVKDPRVEEAFKPVREQLRVEARRAYERLQQAA